jgi:hypothetical protein
MSIHYKAANITMDVRMRQEEIILCLIIAKCIILKCISMYYWKTRLDWLVYKNVNYQAILKKVQNWLISSLSLKSWFWNDLKYVSTFFQVFYFLAVFLGQIQLHNHSMILTCFLNNFKWHYEDFQNKSLI